MRIIKNISFLWKYLCLIVIILFESCCEDDDKKQAQKVSVITLEEKWNDCKVYCKFLLMSTK